MNKICSNIAVPVDFNNRDKDGAVRLITNGTTEFLRSKNILLEEGARIRMTDGELFAFGSLVHKDGIWVATITDWQPNE